MTHYNYANEAWIGNLKHVMKYGSIRSPRGRDTYEMIDHSCSFDMNFPICYHQDRGLSYKFMAAEAWWIISGSMFAEDIVPYNNHIAQFSDDNYIFNGNYGVPFIHQLGYVTRALMADTETRQAALTIWRPNPIKTKDYPCTISLLFMIRDNQLHTKVTMRSQDLWLGQPYDFFNFTMMSAIVANIINEERRLSNEMTPNSTNFKMPLELGRLHWSAFSTHIYSDNYDAAYNVVNTLPKSSLRNTSKITSRCLNDLKFLKDSLLHCRDGGPHNPNYWRIRP